MLKDFYKFCYLLLVILLPYGIIFQFLLYPNDPRNLGMAPKNTAEVNQLYMKNGFVVHYASIISSFGRHKS